jgi:hypothetical protein
MLQAGWTPFCRIPGQHLPGWLLKSRPAFSRKEVPIPPGASAHHFFEGSPAVMKKDPAELARDCPEYAAICTAETRAALHEMAAKYDRMAATPKAVLDLPG